MILVHQATCLYLHLPARLSAEKPSEEETGAGDADHSATDAVNTSGDGEKLVKSKEQVTKLPGNSLSLCTPLSPPHGVPLPPLPSQSASRGPSPSPLFSVRLSESLSLPAILSPPHGVPLPPRPSQSASRSPSAFPSILVFCLTSLCSSSLQRHACQNSEASFKFKYIYYIISYFYAL